MWDRLLSMASQTYVITYGWRDTSIQWLLIFVFLFSWLFVCWRQGHKKFLFLKITEKFDGVRMKSWREICEKLQQAGRALLHKWLLLGNLPSVTNYDNLKSLQLDNPQRILIRDKKSTTRQNLVWNNSAANLPSSNWISVNWKICSLPFLYTVMLICTSDI